MHLSTPLFLLVSLFSLPAINGLTLCLYEREIGASTANGTIAAAAECFAGKGEGMQLCWKDAANGGVVLGEKCREVIESGGAEANGFSVVYVDFFSLSTSTVAHPLVPPIAMVRSFTPTVPAPALSVPASFLPPRRTDLSLPFTRRATPAPRPAPQLPTLPVRSSTATRLLAAAEETRSGASTRGSWGEARWRRR